VYKGKSLQGRLNPLSSFLSLPQAIELRVLSPGSSQAALLVEFDDEEAEEGVITDPRSVITR
jgi:hypothetical protein